MVFEQFWKDFKGLRGARGANLASVSSSASPCWLLPVSPLGTLEALESPTVAAAAMPFWLSRLRPDEPSWRRLQGRRGHFLVWKCRGYTYPGYVFLFIQGMKKARGGQSNLRISREDSGEDMKEYWGFAPNICLLVPTESPLQEAF